MTNDVLVKLYVKIQVSIMKLGHAFNIQECAFNNIGIRIKKALEQPRRTQVYVDNGCLFWNRDRCNLDVYFVYDWRTYNNNRCSVSDSIFITYTQCRISRIAIETINLMICFIVQWLERWSVAQRVPVSFPGPSRLFLSINYILK